MAALTGPPQAVAGRYLANGAPAPAAPFARDARRCADLWDASCGLLGMETHESLA